MVIMHLYKNYVHIVLRFSKVLRRSSSEEKVLSIVRQRKGHSCDFTFIVIAIVLWDGVARNQADSLYVELKKTLNEHGEPTNRKCGTNKGQVSII